VVGEGVRDPLVAGGFVGPAAGLGVGFEGLDVGELAGAASAYAVRERDFTRFERNQQVDAGGEASPAERRCSGLASPLPLR
jgi:hypothetical protein